MASPLRVLWALLLGVLLSPAAATAPFSEWLDELRADARAAGISAATLERALTGLHPNTELLARQRRQPEMRESLRGYLQKRVSPARVAAGRDSLERYADLLGRIAADFGVQPRFVIALWGLESDYGAASGDTPVIGALATLAYDGRRRAYFRRELLAALGILEAGDVPLERMRGSWAGAMGQCQFMPWNYSHRAVDFDGDGRRDIWRSTPDVLASIAHFLSKCGWRDDLTWGRRVHLTRPVRRALYGHAHPRPLSAWQALGVRRFDGRDLPIRCIDAALIRPSGGHGDVYLVYANYRALLKWNNADHFALAVGQLADRLRGR